MLGIAALLVVCVAAAVGVRRWIHHAQLELVPVIVPPTADVQAVVAPPASSIASRMMEDVRDLVDRPARPRLAVLTFDDGPYPVETSALVVRLAQLHAPADFFFIGDDARTQPAIARRVAGAGIEIGNHTLTHPEMTSLDPQAQSDEVRGGAAVLDALVAAPVRYFRPPHGNYDAATLQAAEAAGEIVALWDDDPGDWRTVTADQIVASVELQARAPAVILLHDGKDATIDALPRIVADFRAAGFEFVTLSELQRRATLDAIDDPQKVRL